MQSMEALKHISGLAELIGVVQGFANTARREGNQTYADYLDRCANDGRVHLDALAEAVVVKQPE
jgi:hypothetical protein